jgi:hypothetical protein
MREDTTMPNAYLVRCIDGGRRYWRAIRINLNCTFDEFPAQLAAKMHIPLEHIVAIGPISDLEVARVWGELWMHGKP